MNFATPGYLAFLLVVLLVYWQIGRKAQNLFLLMASYFFYAQWDWRFLSLILVSTITDYVAGARIQRATSAHGRKSWLLMSLVINLGILGYFKYFNFFAHSLVDLFQALGWHISYTTAHIILPVGISFYTFQTMSYTIDIYRRKLQPTRSLIDFAAFVAFFPQLVAGPIVRAREFLYQLEAPRVFRGADLDTGATRFLTGFFKKAFVADTLALVLVDPVFRDPTRYSSSTLWLAMFAFGAQVYFDFSGYSNMAIGSARMLGFEIPENFNFPYLSRNFSEVWRRWHMTMSRFFRDYVYIGLGGNRRGEARTRLNLAATVILSGLWHGAAWTYVAFGLVHGAYLVIQHAWQMLRARFVRPATAARLQVPATLAAWALTFLFWNLGLVLFRAAGFDLAAVYLRGLLGSAGTEAIPLGTLGLIALVALPVDHVAGWIMEHRPAWAARVPLPVRAAALATTVIFLYHAVPKNVNPFVYFQF